MLSFVDLNSKNLGSIVEPECELSYGIREMKLKEIQHWNFDKVTCENKINKFSQNDHSQVLSCSVLISQPFIPPQRYIYTFQNTETSFIPVSFSNIGVFDLSTAMHNPDYFLLSNFTMFTEYVQNEPIQFLLPPFREDLTDADQWRAGQYRVILKISNTVPKIQAKFGSWYDKFIVSYTGAAIIYINSDLLEDPAKLSKIFREITSSGEFRQEYYSHKATRFYERQFAFAEQIQSVGYHVQTKGYPISFWGPDMLFWVQGADSADKLSSNMHFFTTFSTIRGVVFEDDYTLETERNNYFKKVGSKKGGITIMDGSKQVNRLKESLKAKMSKDAEVMVLVRDGENAEADDKQMIYRDIRDDFINAGELPLYLTYGVMRKVEIAFSNSIISFDFLTVLYPEYAPSMTYRLTHISQFFERNVRRIDATQKSLVR